MRYFLTIFFALYGVGVAVADPVIRHAIGAMPPPESHATVAKTPTSEASKDNIKRAQFATAIQDREPINSLTNFDATVGRVYFFTEVEGLKGQTIMHRWEHKGAVVHEQSLEITSGRFRTYSTKALSPAKTGEWKVSVVDGNGVVLSTHTFVYGDANTTAQAQ
ncbi:MAG: DUF2914 domain-containing protein [Pseudomonadota bacterium]